MKLVQVATIDQIRIGAGLRVVVDGRELALFGCGDRHYAVSNVCAHQHFSLLHRGIVRGCTVECPMHGWTYDLRTGRSTTGEGSIAAFPVKIEGRNVSVELPDDW